MRDLKGWSDFCVARITLNSTMTLDQRDALWVRLYPMITFRSDSYVVWGYVESREIGSAHIGDRQGGIRRFVALLDGSWANLSPSEGGNPQHVRVLAVKEMPR
jgi:hypothetical protein